MSAANRSGRYCGPLEGLVDQLAMWPNKSECIPVRECHISCTLWQLGRRHFIVTPLKDSMRLKAVSFGS